ncbi:MAG: PAS domain S-box protein [Candidatus Thorarchaeota archaeon]|nr:PAS domain S-box protein [Candidatus Thorarchaeota archaeon]
MNPESNKDELLKYHALMDSTNDGFGVVDDNKILLYVNKRFGEILGYTSEEMVGKEITEFVDEENRIILEENIKKRKDHLPSSYEISWTAKSGDLVSTIVSGAPLLDKEGTHKGSFAVIADVTAINEAKEALERSEMRYRRVVESMNEGLVVVDDRWVITYVNPSFEKMLGYAYDDTIGKRFSAFIVKELQDSISRWIETREPGVVRSFEIAWLAKDGRKVFTSTSPRGLYDQENNLYGFIGVLIDITEKRLAEKALAESEERYRTLAEKSLQGITVIQDHKYAYVNPAFGAIVGYTPGEILAMESEIAWNLIYPDDKQYLLDLSARRNAGEEVPSSYEYRLVKRDGTVRWVEAFSSIIIYNGEDAHQIHVIDITDRKVAQIELKASQDMLGLVMKHIPQHIFWKDTSSIYLGCNENFARVSGAGTPENIIGKSDFDLAWRREEAETYRKIDRRVIETGQPNYDRIDMQLQADGNDAWLRTTIVPLYDGKGKIVGIMGAQEDVTEKLAIEKAVRKSEAKYRTLAEQSLQGLTVVSDDDSFLYVNRAFADMVGRSVEDLLELKGEGVWNLLHPEDRAVFQDRINAMRENKPVPPRHEYRFVRSDGTFRWMEAYAQVIDYQGTAAIQTVWVDISNRRKAEKDVRTEKDRATLYLDLMGHDIRQQLQVIMNCATLLRTATEDDVRTSFFGIIEEAVQRCSRKIEEVRATEHLLAMPLVMRSIPEAIQGVSQALEHHSTSTTFHLDIRNMNAEIMADDYLELLVTNILMNAIEHNPEPKKNVWIALEESENGFTIVIGDDGKGIGDKRKGELFDMARRYGGVGLHQSTQIVEKYGGNITVTDRVRGSPNKGAEFRIWLPKVGRGPT